MPEAISGARCDLSPQARRLGLWSAAAAAALMAAYAAVLAVGLLTLPSPDVPIGDPLFSVLEVLIIALMPPLVALMAAVHAWTPARLKAFSLTALVFMGLVAGVTCGLHFVILTLRRPEAAAGWPGLGRLLEFRWPSLAYALDILAWDIFFPLAVLFAAAVFRGRGLASWIRRLMVLSGVLAFAGLAGVAAGDMGLRNVGIVGYVGVFFAVTVLLAVLFRRAAAPPDATGGIDSAARSSP
ncbi:MAG: hypothetical protein KA243_06100 [Candidatus Aminicenantes bacterium]|nr:hypothetical protein [Candidatus Aminicenantes bacterium]